MYIKIAENKRTVDHTGLISFHENFYNSCMDLKEKEKLKVFDMFLGNVFQELGFTIVGEGRWYKERYLITYNKEDSYSTTLSIDFDWYPIQKYHIHSGYVEHLCLGDVINISSSGLREGSGDVTLDILLDRVIKDLRNIWKHFVLKQELSEEDEYII